MISDVQFVYINVSILMSEKNNRWTPGDVRPAVPGDIAERLHLIARIGTIVTFTTARVCISWTFRCQNYTFIGVNRRRQKGATALRKNLQGQCHLF